MTTMKKNGFFKRATGTSAWIFSTVAVLFSLTGCSGVSILTSVSDRLDRKIVIDGQPDDWLGKMSYLRDENVLIGFLNDAENLYLCLQVEGLSRQNQIINDGLTVWFDSQGGHEKKFGLRYPAALKPGGSASLIRRDPQDIRQDSNITEFMSNMEIFESPSGKGKVIPLKDAKGVEVKAVPWGAGVVFELKIPLVRTAEHPYAVGVQPVETVGIGLETSRSFDKLNQSPSMAGIPRGGMRPSSGAGWDEWNDDRRAITVPKPLQLWEIVKLSRGNRP